MKTMLSGGTPIGMLSASQAAEYLGVDRTTVVGLVDRGALKSAKTAEVTIKNRGTLRRMFFTKADLDAWKKSPSAKETYDYASRWSGNGNGKTTAFAPKMQRQRFDGLAPTVTVKKLAKDHGVSVQQIRNVLNKAGVKPIGYHVNVVLYNAADVEGIAFRQSAQTPTPAQEQPAVSTVTEPAPVANGSALPNLFKLSKQIEGAVEEIQQNMKLLGLSTVTITETSFNID